MKWIHSKFMKVDSGIPNLPGCTRRRTVRLIKTAKMQLMRSTLNSDDISGIDWNAIFYMKLYSIIIEGGKLTVSRDMFNYTLKKRNG